MKRFLIILGCFLIVLPAFAGFKTVMSRCMESWKGYSIDEVISLWGYPTRKDNFAGRQLYFWDQSQSYVYGNQYGVYGGTNTCTRIIEVNDDNKVIGWEVKGNSCPSTYCGAKKWVNPLNDPWKIEKEQKQQIKQLKKEKNNH